MSKLEILEADLSSIKGQSKALGVIKYFSGHIPNIQCVNDVEAWLTIAFWRVDGEGEPYHEDREVGKYVLEDDIPTFRSFSDFYVILAILEELEGISSRRLG
jgi:hypothetical protein